MSVIERTPTTPFGAIAAYRLIDTIDHLAEAVRSYLSARATQRYLNALSDELLDDIGLTRGDIEEVAWSPARRVRVH